MLIGALFLLTLALSAFFSGAETAFITSNRLKLHVYYYDEPRTASSQKLLKSDHRFLTTTLVGNNFVNAACSSLAVLVFSPFVDSAVLVLGTTAFLLIFTEILPKSIAAQIPNRLSRFTPTILVFFYIIFYPLIVLTESLSRLLVRLVVHQPITNRLFSKIDLPVLIREYATTALSTSHDQVLLASALKIRDRRLWDVMVPRTDIVGVEENDPLDHVKQVFKESGFSRLPVYKEHLDQISGFYYARDFFTDGVNEFPPLRASLFLPESMRVLEALQTLQKSKKSIAVTVDEHGGTAGLITVEDIVEKLVGSISDEFDKPRSRVQISGQRTLVADGRTSIDELKDIQKMHLPEGDYVTIAGLLEDKLEYIPTVGEKIEINGYSIEVMEANAQKVIQVRITAPLVIE